MIFFLPIGHERNVVRRLPRVSIAIVLVNVVVFLFSHVTGSRREEARVEQAGSKLLEKFGKSPHTDISPEVLDYFVQNESHRNDLRREIELVRAVHRRPAPVVLRADQEEMDRLSRDFLRALHDSYGFRLGFVPTRPTVTGAVLHIFTHAGWLHLVGNMWFFLLCAPFLEDVYGRPLFAAFYLLCGLAAMLTQWAKTPDAMVPLVGASGAVAGLMGAALVRFGRTRIRFGYLLIPLYPIRLMFLGTAEGHRIWRGSVWLPAWVMLPLWLIKQLWLDWKWGEVANVAFAAHIGGFAFGALASLALKLARLEERYIHPAIESMVSFDRHPALVRAIEARSAGRYKQARFHLGEALKATPGDPDVHLELYRTALALGEEATAREAAIRNVELELRAGRPDPAWETYLEAETRWPGLPWPPSLLLALGRARERANDDVAAVDTFDRLAALHPADPAAARALAQRSARAARLGDPDDAIAFLERALRVAGLEPGFREELETRLADLRAAHPARPAPRPPLPPPVQPPPVKAPPVQPPPPRES